VEAIYYCNKLSISHRDLKPENFIFATKDPNSKLKLIDFGLSRSYMNEDESIV